MQSVWLQIENYRASNAIMAKLGSNNKPVTLNLIASIALPVLTYSLEALYLNKTDLTSLNHSWMRAFEKLFNTFDKNVLKQCQIYNGYLSITHYYCLNSVSFLNKLSSSPNLLNRHLFDGCGNENMYRLAQMFNCKPEIFARKYWEIIHKHFREAE